MATQTTNLGLIKPAGTDKIRIAQINGNMDILDEKLGAVGNTSLQAQMTNVKSLFGGTYGSAQSPVTNLSDLPIGSEGTCVLDSIVAPPSSSGVALSFQVTGTNSNRTLVVSRASTQQMWMNHYTSNAWSGWNELATNDQVINKTKKLELTSTGSNLDSVIHAWMTTHRSSLSTGEPVCITGVFNNTMYYGMLVKVAAKVIVGTMFTPNSSNGFRFRDSSDDSTASHVDFTL